MTILFRREFYNKAVSLLLTLAFLAESTLAPVLLFLPQTAFAQTAQTVVISRTPATSATNPYKVGNSTTLSSVNPPSIFATDQPVTMYDQIGTNAIRITPNYTTTFKLRDSGSCNTTTGACSFPGVWDAAGLVCPAGVTGVQQNTEWYTVGNLTSNKLTWYFQCSASGVSSAQTPVGSLDGIDANGTASGWAVDPDSSATSISAHFYIDGAAGQGGTFVGSANANLASSAANNQGYSGNHGYTFSIPAQWRDGKPHTLYVHGIDLSGDGSKNVLLSNVPKSFTLGTAAQTVVISRTPATSATNPYKVGNSTTLSSVNPPSIFATDQPVTMYDQIGTNAIRITPNYTTTFKLRDSGSCNTTTGACSFPGVWDAAGLVCPAGVTGVQQNTEWYTVGTLTSNKLTWYFECSATSPTNIYVPTGSLDGISTDGLAFGWATDQDAPSVNISTHFYVDGAAGQGGTFVGSAQAGSSATNHRFSFSIPAKWRDGKPHTLYVHGIDLSGDGSKNVLLSNVPKSFTLGTSVSNNPSLSVSPVSFSAGASATISVANAAPDTIVKVFCRDPNNVVCDDSVSYTTNASGQFTHTYDTTGWTEGTYQGWVTVGNAQSNVVNFTVITPATQTGVLPIGATAVYKGGGQLWAASRIDNQTIVFQRWTDPLSSNNVVWRSRSQDGRVMSESSSELYYSGVNLYTEGVPADTFGSVDGSYDIWITKAGIYVASSGSARPSALTALRIGYGNNPVVFSKQWCGYQTICNKFFARDLWDGWPLWGFLLQKENSNEVTEIILGPFGPPTEIPGYKNFENIQGYFVNQGAYRQYRGYNPSPCSDWTKTLGLCTDGSLYAGIGASVRFLVQNITIPWWSETSGNNTPECVDFGIPGASYPKTAVAPHGVAMPIISRTSPTRAESTWAASTEGTCVGTSLQSTTPPSDRPNPTPTTAPMATLTLERDQEQVLPDQPISFSGTLDASKVAFPQGSSLIMAISDGVSVDRIEIDGDVLATSAFSVNGGSIKIPFGTALYSGSHTFRLVLRNTLPVQLDRRVSVWVTAVDAGNTLLLKGRTASTMMAHLPTEVIGRGTSIAIGTGYYDDGSYRTFRYLQSAQEIDVTRGPFFTPTSVPSLPDNIAFTLFPGDASMQRVAFSLKQFSDPLAREFITAQYQYLLGRDPSSEEVSRYLPLFTQWRNSLGALMEVYNRRADVREFVRTKERVITGNKNGKAIYASNLPNYDKLIEWATTQGWKEESTLQSFKMQTGYDDAWKLFDALWEKWALLAAGSSTGWSETTTPSSVMPQRDSFSFIVEMCGGTVPSEVGGWVGKPDFAACWNNPIKRHRLILWAKDIGWAYNKVVQDWSVTTPGGSGDNVQTGQNIVEINPSGPILASVFGPGKYPEYAAETAMRYPPAQMYYDLVSSSEYASFPESRFRKNVDSIFRLFYSRPAAESDIAWTKNMFIRGGGDNYDRYDPTWSWINPQWEPNGQLIASNFEYVDPVEFVKNPRYINDDVYGTRHIPGEIDAVSARLLEVMEKQKYQRTELYQGDNFKRIVVGLYRLYLRRNPTDAEVASERASGKDFGDIEFKLNQSAEYGKNPASRDAVRSIYRNYLGRDPSDADIASGTLKSISSFANSIGTSGEMKVLAQAHSENAYIFPVKRIKIVSCGFFCSIMGRIIGVALNFIPVVGPALSAAYFGAGISQGSLDGLLGTSVGGVHYGNATSIMIGSISRSFGEAGFNGETFVQYASIARAMAGQAGGVFSMANLLENADSTILAGFRTMAVAPQTPQGNAFAGLASPLVAVAGLFGAKQEVSAGRIAQIDVSSHYGSGAVTPASRAAAPTKGKPGANTSLPAKIVTPVSFTKTLVQGSRGAEVLKLQKVLGGADLTFLPEYQTGYYGAKTVAAVKRFQKRYGLEQVGFVGSRTRALLNSAR